MDKNHTLWHIKFLISHASIEKLAHNSTPKLKFSHSLYCCMICYWPPLPEIVRLPLFVPLVNSKMANIHPNDRLLNPSMGMTSKSYLWCPFEKSHPPYPFIVQASLLFTNQSCNALKHRLIVLVLNLPILRKTRALPYSWGFGRNSHSRKYLIVEFQSYNCNCYLMF